MSGLHDAALGTTAVLKSGARGLLRRVRHGDASFTVDASDEVGLVLNLSEAHRVEGTMAGLAVCRPPRVGSITVMPPNCRGCFTITGECRVLQLRLPWSRIVRAAGAPRETIALRPRFNQRDPQLARLLYAVAIAGDDADEAIAGVASHLVAGRAATEASTFQARSGGIAPARLARVLEQIDADVDGATSLEALAGEAGMSPFHFARAFARTVGLPPHSQVIRRRVDRAILLLSFPTLTIADVARRAGFCHSSHLARHMRRLIGASPEVVRARILP